MSGYLTLHMPRISVGLGKGNGTARRVLDPMFLERGSPQLTHELLVTLMAEFTGLINSRPITVVPSDIDQPHPLTPNMLLTMKTQPEMKT